METIKTIATGVLVAVIAVCALIIMGEDNGCSFGLFVSLKIAAFVFIAVAAKMLKNIDEY